MKIRAGERLHLTLEGAGSRAMVSLNTYAVTQPAIEALDPSEDGFSYDVTRWLSQGRNVLTVVLIGPPGPQPFQLTVASDGTAAWTLDEAEFLPSSAPWRLWTHEIELHAPDVRTGTTVSAAALTPSA